MDEAATLRGLIRESPLLAVYYSTPTCSVCKVLRPKVEDLISDLAPWQFFYVDVSQNADIRGQGMIFNVPTVILYAQGREIKRFSRNFGVGELEEVLLRYQSLIAPS